MNWQSNYLRSAILDKIWSLLIIPSTTIAQNASIDILNLWDYTVQSVVIKQDQFQEKQKQAKMSYEYREK